MIILVHIFQLALSVKADAIELSDYEKLYEWIPKLLGREVPPLVSAILGFLVLVMVLILVVTAIATAIGHLADVYSKKLKPLCYNAEKRREARLRKIFAWHLSNELRTRNRAENWRDEEFTELKAEVEAEGRRRGVARIFSSKSRQRGMWRARSLAKALRLSSERLILLEGDPGSGKSVTLRHVALTIAERASKSGSTESLVPIYVNLKELKREIGKPVDKQLIEQFILDSLNRVNDVSVTRFIEAAFRKGIENGTWLFLFDSFDEIPDVLSSTEVDERISEYSIAINSFLTGFNTCRGIVASRHYRGPASLGWRRFRVVELSTKRQLQLIKRAHLPNNKSRSLINELVTATTEIKTLARNPMLLGLLCEHMHQQGQFPTTSHEVFSEYLNSRIARDSASVQQRFNLAKAEIISWTEKVAFALAVDERLGLSPTRGDLKLSLSIPVQSATADQLDTVLDALEYMRLGRADREVSGDERQFTFSHRRFQEYFATSVVIEDLRTISPRRLLLDARWRETAVTLLQLGLKEDVEPLVEEAVNLLTAFQVKVTAVSKSASKDDPFDWPYGLLHLLSLLQAGYAARARELGARLDGLVTSILTNIASNNCLDDKKLVLEVAGLCNETALTKIIDDALVVESQWLNDTIFLQVSRLSVLTPEIHQWIRAALKQMTLSGELSRNYETVRAYISRIRSPEKYLLMAWVGRTLRPIDFVMSIVCGALVYYLIFAKFPYVGLLVFPIAIIYFAIYWVVPRSWADLSRVNLTIPIVIAAIISLVKEPVGVFTAGHVQITAILMMAYVTSWVIFAADAITVGPFWKPPLLPLAHLTLIWRFFEERPSLKVFVRFVITIAFVGAVSALLFVFIPKRFWQLAVTSLSVAAFILVSPPFLISIVRNVISFQRDRRVFKIYENAQGNGFDDWFTMYHGLSGAYWKFRAAQHARENGRISINLDQEGMLRPLIPIVRANVVQKKLSWPGTGIAWSRLRKAIKGRRDRFGLEVLDMSRMYSGIGRPEVRDELYRLIDASRRGRMNNDGKIDQDMRWN